MKNHFAKQCKSKVKTHQVGEGLSDTESSEEYLFSATTPETTDNVNAISEEKFTHRCSSMKNLSNSILIAAPR